MDLGRALADAELIGDPPAFIDLSIQRFGQLQRQVRLGKGEVVGLIRIHNQVVEFFTAVFEMADVFVAPPNNRELLAEVTNGPADDRVRGVLELRRCPIGHQGPG